MSRPFKQHKIVTKDGTEGVPTVPQFIVKAPWYVGQDDKAKRQSTDAKDDQQTGTSIHLHGRERRVVGVATKFRKGACENCGSMTHRARDCVERPRKVGARWTGRDIQPDELVEETAVGYDGKRDRWEGYDPEEYSAVVTDWEELEHRKRETAADCPAQDLYAEDASMPGQRVDLEMNTRMTVRNLRLREDTAKYLMNLDLDSAYYDPKSRSMRESPFPGKDPAQCLFAGDNVGRVDNTVSELNQVQVFAWNAPARSEFHAQATPSQAEFAYKQAAQQNKQASDAYRSALYSRYGGREYVQENPLALVSEPDAKSEAAASAATKSIFAEDIYPFDHQSVWGSYYVDGRWGYACCKSTERHRPCKLKDAKGG